MKRLVKLTLFAAVIGGLVVAARKLMGGLGPQPGAPEAPKEWPSLVPEPATVERAAIPDPGAPGDSRDSGDSGAAPEVAPIETPDPGGTD